MQLRLLLGTAKHCNNEKFIWDNCRQTCHIFILDLFNQLHNSFLHRMTCYAELLHRTTRHQCSYTAQIKTATNFGDLQASAFDIISQSDKLLTAFVQTQDNSLYTSQLQLCFKLVTALGNRQTEIIRLWALHQQPWWQTFLSYTDLRCSINRPLLLTFVFTLLS